MNGPSKLLWGFFANEGLRGLGQSDGAALSWTLLGAIGIEWFVYTHRTKIVTVPREWSHVEKNLPGGKKITMDVEWPEGVPAPPPGYFEGLSPTVDWGHHW
ncbi:MAG TPA: hypothetical protein VFA98_05115 [Thermoanaerobaculia bacterium]|nr:hypothetical protein [Thermoanaerobaculia bacterium]